jgi:tetratricopeptide (TPR) repeat protein
MLTDHSNLVFEKSPRSARALGIAVRLALALVMIVASAACQSGPVRAFQGARYYAAGSESLDRGDGEKAVQELLRAAELVPHASEVQNHLGLAYLATGDSNRARVAFEAAIELDCDNEAARLNLVSVMPPQASGFSELRDPERSDGDGG